MPEETGPGAGRGYSMAYVKLELLCKVMGPEGSRIRSKIRMSQSTAISPLVPRSSDLFRMSPARTLVSPVLCSAALGEGTLALQ